jgi:hypothetical protein
MNSPAASFVLPIRLTNPKFCDSRCPFGQIDNRRQILYNLLIEFSDEMLTCGLKEGIKAVSFVRLIFHGSSMA